MGIKTYKPYTPSRRQMSGSDFSEITKKAPEKSLVVSLQKNSGRNNQGKIARHTTGTILISPDGRRSVAYLPSFAISCAEFPAAWGKPALGLKTRKKNKQSNKLIVRRRDGKALNN